MCGKPPALSPGKKQQPAMLKAAVDPMELAEAGGRDGVDNGTAAEIGPQLSNVQQHGPHRCAVLAKGARGGKEAMSVTFGSKSKLSGKANTQIEALPRNKRKASSETMVDVMRDATNVKSRTKRIEALGKLDRQALKNGVDIDKAVVEMNMDNTRIIDASGKG
ncbi:unnamed protein product [Heligmosomoides polygyrus]|uniref:ABC transporter domain-containing protein n=1 Tax=Heligmosomoides polygyrus TaxID=6339 RepID=A0A183G0V9_HELPZ|nr:unnamed protein product [Heligmosomoides polygyrus]